MRLTPSDASETMPRPLWNDHHHPGFQRIGLRPVLGHDVKSHRTVDDLHGAHGDRHHGVWYSGPEVRPVSADRERVPHRASLAGGQSDRRQHRRPAADRAGWRGDGFRRDPLPRDHARYRRRRGTAGPGGAAGHYTRGAAPPAGGDLVRLSGVHGNPLALSSARRSGRNSGADIAAAGHSRVRGSSIANVRCWVG